MLLVIINLCTTSKIHFNPSESLDYHTKCDMNTMSTGFFCILWIRRKVILSQVIISVQGNTCIVLKPTFTSESKCFWSITDACFTYIVSFNCNSNPYEVLTTIILIVQVKKLRFKEVN